MPGPFTNAPRWSAVTVPVEKQGVSENVIVPVRFGKPNESKPCSDSCAETLAAPIEPVHVPASDGTSVPWIVPLVAGAGEGPVLVNVPENEGGDPVCKVAVTCIVNPEGSENARVSVSPEVVPVTVPTTPSTMSSGSCEKLPDTESPETLQ